MKVMTIHFQMHLAMLLHLQLALKLLLIPQVIIIYMGSSCENEVQESDEEGL